MKDGATHDDLGGDCRTRYDMGCVWLFSKTKSRRARTVRSHQPDDMRAASSQRPLSGTTGLVESEVARAVGERAVRLAVQPRQEAERRVRRRERPLMPARVVRGGNGNLAPRGRNARRAARCATPAACEHAALGEADAGRRGAGRRAPR